MSRSHKPALHKAMEPLHRSYHLSNAAGRRISSADPEWASQTFGTAGSELPCHVCEVVPGQILIFHHSLLHSAYYHFPGRAFFAAKFAARPETDAHHASNMRYAAATH
eukprot:COSAG04_NODE_16549_length_496_cov_0.647355_1_plen_107_part_10